MNAGLPCRGIIFDLDGVLVDSTRAVNASWEAWATKHGIDAQLAIANGHGRPSIEAIRLTAPHLNARESFAEMEALEESFLQSVTAVCGAPEFVRRVDALGVPWAVATSGTRRIALPRLERAGIPKPPALITADDIERGKPDPEPYETAARAIGVAPWDCTVFEDAPAGIRSARRAGAAVVAIGSIALSNADASALDFLDVKITAAEQGHWHIATLDSHFRCACCECHAKAAPDDTCALCLWPSDPDYALEEARRNTRAFGVMYRAADSRFAPSRHPVLGPHGEYAIDRVALRERAYLEFAAFAANAPNERAHLSQRLLDLLACLRHADRLYRRKA